LLIKQLHTNEQWKSLINGTAETNLAIENTTVDGSKAKVTGAAAGEILNSAAASGAAVEITDMKASRWFYLDAK